MIWDRAKAWFTDKRRPWHWTTESGHEPPVRNPGPSFGDVRLAQVFEQNARIEAKLDQVLAHFSAKPSVTSTFNYTWGNAVQGPKTPEEWFEWSCEAKPFGKFSRNK